MQRPPFQRFIGLWILDRETCDYEQGEPPRSGSYRIDEQDGQAVFEINWVDAQGQSHQMGFKGLPDGEPVRFEAGPLADSLSISAPSDDRLDSAAYRDGIELMTARRTLSADGNNMEIVQTVHLPDGQSPANTATYRRVQ